MFKNLKIIIIYFYVKYYKFSTYVKFILFLFRSKKFSFIKEIINSIFQKIDNINKPMIKLKIRIFKLHNKVYIYNREFDKFHSPEFLNSRFNIIYQDYLNSLKYIKELKINLKIIKEYFNIIEKIIIDIKQEFKNIFIDLCNIITIEIIPILVKYIFIVSFIIRLPLDFYITLLYIYIINILLILINTIFSKYFYFFNYIYEYNKIILEHLFFKNLIFDFFLICEFYYLICYFFKYSIRIYSKIIKISLLLESIDDYYFISLESLTLVNYHVVTFIKWIDTYVLIDRHVNISNNEIHKNFIVLYDSYNFIHLKFHLYTNKFAYFYIIKY